MVKSKAFALEVIRSCQVLREARYESALINWLEILIEIGYYSDRTILDSKKNADFIDQHSERE